MARVWIEYLFSPYSCYRFSVLVFQARLFLLRNERFLHWLKELWYNLARECWICFHMYSSCCNWLEHPFGLRSLRNDVNVAAVVLIRQAKNCGSDQLFKLVAVWECGTVCFLLKGVLRECFVTAESAFKGGAITSYETYCNDPFGLSPSTYYLFLSKFGFLWNSVGCFVRELIWYFRNNGK